MVAEMELLFRLALAAGLGLLVGLERELRQKPAGMRTHALVCMGSCLFALISVAFFGNASVAAGIVTGIGFLGAGTIFFAKDKLHGLTTAAELWVLAAVGLALGMGMYFAAAVTVVLIFFLLVPGKMLEQKIVRRKIKA